MATTEVAALSSAGRFEFDVLPPPYIQHNGSAQDGFGDTATVLKYRIASGNAESGNFDIAASLGHCFATGSHKNGAASNSFTPTVAGGYAFRRFDVISSVGGTLPTSKTDIQGRSIAWTALAQAHATRHVWFEVENNATFFIGGSRDGKDAELPDPRSFLCRASEGMESHAPLLHHRWRNADRHFGLSHLQSQPDLRDADDLLTSILAITPATTHPERFSIRYLSLCEIGECRKQDLVRKRNPTSTRRREPRDEDNCRVQACR